MADLPLQTHRYLIEPLAGTHWKTKIMRGYLGFIKRVRNSSKHVLRQLYHLASRYMRNVTGSNLRNILMLTNKVHVDELEPSVLDTQSHILADLGREVLKSKYPAAIRRFKR